MQNNNVTELGPMLIGIYGDIKTAKTTFLLTAPKPIFFFDFDQGFERAIWRFPEIKHTIITNIAETDTALKDGNQVIRKFYPIPIKWPGQKTTGFLQLWDEVIVPDFMAVYNDARIKTLVIDTGTLMWLCDHSAHLERVGLRSTNPRSSLLPVEYARPNSDMRSLIGAARHLGRNLILTHHVGGVYETRMVKHGRGIVSEEVRVGDTWAGWKEMGGLVDLVARSYTRELTGQDDIGNIVYANTDPFIVVEHCGLTLRAEGFKLSNPTFDQLKQAVETFRMVK